MHGSDSYLALSSIFQRSVIFKYISWCRWYQFFGSWLLYQIIAHHSSFVDLRRPRILASELILLLFDIIHHGLVTILIFVLLLFLF